MKKRILSAILLAAMLLALVACGASTPVDSSKLTKEEMNMEIDFPNVPESLAAKMEIDIYLIAGQSNASGSTAIDNAKEGERDNNTYENVRYYFVSQWTDGTNHFTHRTYEAVHEGLGFDSDHVGPELGMARVLNDRYATNERKALIVKVASGGTMMLANEADGQGSITKNAWERFLLRGSWYPQAMQKDGNTDPNRPTGFLTRQLCATAKEVFDDLISKGFSAENIHFKALCWMQGESDRTAGRKYYNAFIPFAEEVRTSISETTGADYSELPIVMGEISETFKDATSGTVKYNQQFIQIQHKLAEDVPAVTVIPTGSFKINDMINGESVPVGTDESHWSYHDMMIIGEMFGNTAYEVSHPAE